jgi:hypothetical protein
MPAPCPCWARRRPKHSRTTWRAASRDRPAHGLRQRIRILFEPRSETAGHSWRRCAGVMQKGYFGANADEIAALAASSNAPSRAVCAIEPARPPRNRSVGALNLSTHTAAAKLTLRHSLAESQLFAHSRHSLRPSSLRRLRTAEIRTMKSAQTCAISKAGNSTSFPRLERRAIVSAVCLPRLGDNSRRVSRRVLMDLKRLFPQHPSARDRIPSAVVQ